PRKPAQLATVLRLMPRGVRAKRPLGAAGAVLMSKWHPSDAPTDSEESTAALGRSLSVKLRFRPIARGLPAGRCMIRLPKACTNASQFALGECSARQVGRLALQAGQEGIAATARQQNAKVRSLHRHPAD